MKCENCGFENKDGEFYCANCKHKLPDADETIIKYQQGLISNGEVKKRINRIRFFYVLFTIVAIILILIIGKVFPYGGTLYTLIPVLILSAIPFFSKYDIYTENYSKEIMNAYKDYIFEAWRNNKFMHFLFYFFILQVIVLLFLIVSLF